MEPVVVGRNLETPALIPHRIVVGDDAVFLHTQDVGQTGPHPRHNRRPRLSGGYRKVPVVGREKLLGEIAVGRSHRGDPGEGQLFGQPILQGAEDPLGAPPGFR